MGGLTEATLDHFNDLHERVRKVVAGLDTAAVTRAPAEGENSIAVLVTHTLGSELGCLHHAAGIPFKRDRPSEFRTRASAAEIETKIDSTAPIVADLIHKSKAAGFGTMRACDNGQEQTVGYCVMHALSHAAEHVGHAELTRNLLGRLV